MAKEQDSRHAPYDSERSTEPNSETGNIDTRNNNINVSTPGPTDPTVESANNTGIGDAAVNDQKLTGHTANHAADA